MVAVLIQWSLGLKYIPDVIPVSEVYSLGLEYVEGKHYFEAKTLTNVLNYMIQLLKVWIDFQIYLLICF